MEIWITVWTVLASLSIAVVWLSLALVRCASDGLKRRDALLERFVEKTIMPNVGTLVTHSNERRFSEPQPNIEIPPHLQDNSLRAASGDAGSHIYS